MARDKRSFIEDFTDPDKIEAMAHLTPRMHRRFVAHYAMAKLRGQSKLKEVLEYYLKTTPAVMYKPANVRSEQEVEVLRQHAEAVERVEDPPEELPSGLFRRKKKEKKEDETEVRVDGQNARS